MTQELETALKRVAEGRSIEELTSLFAQSPDIAEQLECLILRYKPLRGRDGNGNDGFQTVMDMFGNEIVGIVSHIPHSVTWNEKSVVERMQSLLDDGQYERVAEVFASQAAIDAHVENDEKAIGLLNSAVRELARYTRSFDADSPMLSSDMVSDKELFETYMNQLYSRRLYDRFVEEFYKAENAVFEPFKNPDLCAKVVSAAPLAKSLQVSLDTDIDAERFPFQVESGNTELRVEYGNDQFAYRLKMSGNCPREYRICLERIMAPINVGVPSKLATNIKIATMKAGEACKVKEGECARVEVPLPHSGSAVNLTTLSGRDGETVSADLDFLPDVAVLTIGYYRVDGEGRPGFDFTVSLQPLVGSDDSFELRITETQTSCYCATVFRGIISFVEGGAV